MPRRSLIHYITLMLSIAVVCCTISSISKASDETPVPKLPMRLTDPQVLAGLETAMREKRSSTQKPDIVNRFTTNDTWIFGMATFMAPKDAEGGGESYLFLAKRESGVWEVTLEFSPQFERWISEVPDTIISRAEKQVLIPPRSSLIAGNGSAQLSLPWATNEAWTLTGGTHHYCGYAWLDCANRNNGRPWSSIDFSTANGRILAAGDGVAYLSCYMGNGASGNEIKVYHPTGYQTDYYHVINIAVSNNEPVSRGQFLGNVSDQHGCGGSVTGPHLHFALAQSTYIDFAGTDIGGWTVQDGASMFQGCMVRISDGYSVCPEGAIQNDGIIGTGNISPPTITSPTNGSTIMNDRFCTENPGQIACVPIYMQYNGTGTVSRYETQVSPTSDFSSAPTFSLVPPANFPIHFPVPRFGVYYARGRVQVGSTYSGWSVTIQFTFVDYASPTPTKTPTITYTPSLTYTPSQTYTPSPTQMSDTIVPDDSPYAERLGNPAYFYPAQAGSTTRNGAVYTFVNGYSAPDNSIKYKPPLPTTACYRVYAYIAYILNSKYDSVQVPIEVRYRNGTVNLVKDFRNFNDPLGPGPTERWMDLGAYLWSTNAGSVGEYVWIKDNTMEAGAGQVNTNITVNFDDVKWVYDPSCTPTNTPTFTSSPTLTPVPPSNTPTLTASVTSTATLTSTFTATATRTATSTPTNTPIPAHPDTIGTYKDNIFYLRFTNTTGGPDLTVNMYNLLGFAAGDLPVTGDWNGDGIDTVGVYRSSTGFFFLSASNVVPTLAHQVLLGNPGDTPFAGKWRVDMVGDGIGVFRPSNGILYQKRQLTSGFSDYFAVFGNPGDIGFAGDWNGDGLDSIGVYRPSNSTWYMTSNSEPSGITFGDISFVWNIGNNPPVIGDWNADVSSTVGYLSGTIFVLHSTLTATGADTVFSFTSIGQLPIAGKWISSAAPNQMSVIRPQLGGLNNSSIVSAAD